MLILGFIFQSILVAYVRELQSLNSMQIIFTFIINLNISIGGEI